MLASSLSLSWPGAILSILGLIAVVASAWVYFRHGTGKELIDQQDRAIGALKAIVDEQDRQIKALKDQNLQQGAQLEQQARQLRVLTEAVTQAAKVDQLTTLVRTGFQKLGVEC